MEYVALSVDLCIVYKMRCIQGCGTNEKGLFKSSQQLPFFELVMNMFVDACDIAGAALV